MEIIRAPNSTPGREMEEERDATGTWLSGLAFHLLPLPRHDSQTRESERRRPAWRGGWGGGHGNLEKGGKEQNVEEFVQIRVQQAEVQEQKKKKREPPETRAAGAGKSRFKRTSEVAGYVTFLKLRLTLPVA